MNWIHSLKTRLSAGLSLSLMLGQTLSLSLCLAKPIRSQGKPDSSQSVQTSVAVVSFQDESRSGASDEFCQRLGEHLAKKLYVRNRTFSPKSVRTKVGVEWTKEELATFGKKVGVQFVVHSGLLAVSSDRSTGKITSRVQVYADIFSVEAAVTQRVEAEGVGIQKATDSDTPIELGSADFGREFQNTSVGQALFKAIDQLAPLIAQKINSGEVAPDRKPLPEDAVPYKPPQYSTDSQLEGAEGDPGATEEAQEAQADEELQQLIAQAQECLNGLNATQDREKINALIAALQGLTSALEAKANLLEQGKLTETDQTDQEIDAREQELQDAVDQSLPQEQSTDLGPAEEVSSSGESKFDRVVKYVEFGFSVLEKIFDLRARFRGIAQDNGDPYGPYADQGGWDTTEESFEPIDGNVFEDDDAAQAAASVPEDFTSSIVEGRDNASGPNIDDSDLNSWGTSNAEVATTVAGRRRPVVGAEVIEPDSGASTRTDNSGFFTLRVPARSTKLIVKRGGAKVAEVSIHLVRGRATVADIQLGRSGRAVAMQGTRVLPSSVVVNREGRNTGNIRGVVQDAKGQPVPRALIDIQGLAMARTDSQGRFSFIKVSTGIQRLTVRASDSESRSEQVRVKANETVDSRIQLNLTRRIPRVGDRLITPGAGSVLRGTVMDSENRPVPGAKISALSITGLGGAVSVRARTDGSFDLRDLKPGSYQVLVDKVGLVAASQRVSLSGSSTPPLSFRLRKDTTSPFRPGVEETLARNLGEVRGQVRAKNGNPIPNAWLELKGTAKTSAVTSQRTNVRGEYVLRAFPGRYELRVRAKDYQETSRSVIVQTRDPRRENFDLNLNSGAGREGGRLGNGSLTGRVTDTNTHTPISGATLSLEGRSAITDRGGNYSIANIQFGRHQVKVARSGYSDEARTVDVRAGSTNVNFDLRPSSSGGSRNLRETGELEGRVIDEKTGRPLAGARVTMQGRSDTTDQSGKYVVSDVPLGRYQVSVTRGGYQNEKGTVEVGPGSATRKNFSLKSAGGSGSEKRLDATGQLTGRVTDEETGRAISGARVTIQGRSDTTDQAGNYVVTNVPLGRYQVSVTRGGYENERDTVEVRAGSSASKSFKLRSNGGSGSEKRLYESGQLRGRVTDQKTGRPISGARVTIQGRSDTTDQAGNYVITNVPLGRYQVSVTRGGYENERDTVEVRVGSTTNKNFRLIPTAGSGAKNFRVEPAKKGVKP